MVESQLYLNLPFTHLPAFLQRVNLHLSSKLSSLIMSRQREKVSIYMLLRQTKVNKE